ncbi:hypothetical protein GCM10027028_35540 [Streptomyces sundarbansensis]
MPISPWLSAPSYTSAARGPPLTIWTTLLAAHCTAGLVLSDAYRLRWDAEQPLAFNGRSGLTEPHSDAPPSPRQDLRERTALADLLREYVGYLPSGQLVRT